MQRTLGLMRRRTLLRGRASVRLDRALAMLTIMTTTTLCCAPAPGSVAYAAERKLFFYHPDHLGSTTLVTDGQGHTVQRAGYAPFGAVTSRSGTVGLPQGFTGQRMDATTGLSFYHARYYDALLGRFISPDPLVQGPADPQTLNRYAYVRNSPLMFTDPTGEIFGLDDLFVGLLIGAVLGSAINATIATASAAPIGKAALTGAVTGGILGGYGAIAGAMFSSQAVGEIMGGALTMAGAGAIGGAAAAAMSGQPVGQGAALGAGFAFAGGLVPSPNVPWLGRGVVGGLVNPAVNDALKGALMGAGAAAIQATDIGEGAAAGAAFYAVGAGLNATVGHAVGWVGSGFRKPLLREGVFFYERPNLSSAITFGNVVYGPSGITLLPRLGAPGLYEHELAHAQQYRLLGPMFLPLYGGQIPFVKLANGDPFRINLLERYLLFGAPPSGGAATRASFGLLVDEDALRVR